MRSWYVVTVTNPGTGQQRIHTFRHNEWITVLMLKRLSEALGGLVSVVLVEQEDNNAGH